MFINPNPHFSSELVIDGPDIDYPVESKEKEFLRSLTNGKYTGIHDYRDCNNRINLLVSLSGENLIICFSISTLKSFCPSIKE